MSRVRCQRPILARIEACRCWGGPRAHGTRTPPLSLAAGLSPGAGLGTAEEQAEAAYADLIATSTDGRDLSEEEVARLAEGGEMSEAEKGRKSRGLLGDMKELFGALGGGAHIVRKEDGRI